MRVVGLTGGIACGKSTLSAAAARRGIPVLDADEISRALTSPGGDALPEIRRAFGDGMFHANGTLNRRALADAVFSNEEKRVMLENILHPRVWAKILAMLATLRATGVPGVILDVPLLFETGMDEICDTVIVCHVPEAEQLRRLAARDGMTAEEARARIRAQAPLAEKIARADFAIDTSGSPRKTASTFFLLWNALMLSPEEARDVAERCRPTLLTRYP